MSRFSFPIAITMGDPAGIGPEIILKAYKAGELDGCLVIGDLSVLKIYAEAIEPKAVFNLIEGNGPFELKRGYLNLIDMKAVDLSTFEFGKANGNLGLASYEYVKRATELCMKGSCNGVVTCPINKVSLRLAGLPFIGHTEIFSTLSKAEFPLTMFQTGKLRTFFLTRHMALKDIFGYIKKERIVDYVKRCVAELDSLGPVSKPFAIAALNPHASDEGQFGDEEKNEIIPAVNELRSLGYDVVGPVPADSVFHLGLQGNYSAVLSLYHDQGHIACKTNDFDGTVSVTLGLPFLRLSVDHGTAFDIAGKGKADPMTLINVLKVAKELTH